MLDEMDRSLHDSLCVIKRMLESHTLVAGGGAVEAAVSIYLEGLAMSIGSREQLAVAQVNRRPLFLLPLPSNALVVRRGTAGDPAHADHQCCS